MIEPNVEEVRKKYFLNSEISIDHSGKNYIIMPQILDFGPKKKRKLSEYKDFPGSLGSIWSLPEDQTIRYELPPSNPRTLFLNKLAITLPTGVNTGNFILRGFIQLKHMSKFLLFEQPLVYNIDSNKYEVAESPKFLWTEEIAKWSKGHKKPLFLVVKNSTDNKRVTEIVCKIASIGS